MDFQKKLSKVVVKFAGDSGDGMQLSGSQFSNTAAFVGNELSTFPDFPAEIRAPQGTLFGVSGFKIHFGDTQITSPGDFLDVLVVMNAAALKVNLSQVNLRGIIIANENGFTKKDLDKAGFDTNPLEGDYLSEYKLVKAPITDLNNTVLDDLEIKNKDKAKTKNMFALGVIYWLFNRPLGITIDFLKQKFRSNTVLVEANERALKAGYNFAETLELLNTSYHVKEAELPKGKYRSITGNQAAAWGIIAAKERSGLNLFFGSYPITPASDILHEVSKYKEQNITVFQAEDEIAAIAASIGASFAGSLSVTTTSGPGMALKTEALGLAIMSELPLLVINVQRGGPSTGLPTKTEQSDLNQALYGRNGESPLVVISASSPEDCFDKSYLAAKIAIEYMGPVILLTDGYIANGSTPWKIKYIDDMPNINPNIFKEIEGKHYQPYEKDEFFVRKWAIPGKHANSQHRIGGLEKEAITGRVSYDAENHQNMIEARAAKVEAVKRYIPKIKVYGKSKGRLLVVGWGGTYGDLYNSVKTMIEEKDASIALLHLSFINPLPEGLLDRFKSYKHILVCELNLGQLVGYLRSKFSGITFEQYNKVQGQPFLNKGLIEVFNRYIN